MFRSVKSKLTSVLAAVLIASCVAQPVPAQTHQNSAQDELCSSLVEYNLELKSMLQSGFKPEEVVALHLEIIRKNSDVIPVGIINLSNQLVVLTLNNSTAKTSELAPFLMLQCNLLIDSAIKEQQKMQAKPYNML